MNTVVPSHPHPTEAPINASPRNRRVLIVDDNQAIHEDFQKILGAEAVDTDFDDEEAEIFGKAEEKTQRVEFELDFAFQGQEALKKVETAVANGRRYAMAFMDVRMPPGWDGLETTLKLWEADPDLQVVICTAYSDYSWEEMTEMIGTPERLLILKKPFDPIEVLQFAHALTEKWYLLQGSRRNIEMLEHVVSTRTAELKATNTLLQKEIAESRAAGERIREQAMLIEEARDAIIVRDFDEKILFWNRGAERMYGWSAAETVGRTMFDVLHEESAGNEMRAARAVLLERGAWMGEMRQRTRYDGEIFCDCHWTLVRDEAGRPKSILTINSDITEKKKIEAQFLRAQRMESIGTLTGGIAHDLNNILAPALMACDLLNPVTEQDKETLDILSQSLLRGADIIRQILSFARGVEGPRVELDVRRLIAEIDTIATETFPKDIEIKIDAAADLWKLVADPTQVHQILMNLCLNARDAMPEGGTLAIAARNVEAGSKLASVPGGSGAGSYLLITVSDTGTGMPSEIKEKIFDPFFTTKGVGKGTGLGLSTTFGIVKSHGGFIEVDSEPGKGSVFRVYLPIKKGASPADGAGKVTSLPRGRNELILIVDDEEAILALGKRTLETFGYRVVTAKDGIEAMVSFSQHKNEIAAVLTDVMMPIMDGLALIATLRGDSPDLKIIAASGVNTEAQIAKITAAGVSHFVPKPYTARAILSLLDELLRPR